MKKFISLLFLMPWFGGFAQIYTTTPDGKTVVLNADGTWKYTLDKKVQAVLKAALKSHFDSYSHNSRSGVSMLGGGWAKTKFVPFTDYTVDFDGNTATCNFTLTEYISGFHKEKEEANADTVYVTHSLKTHKHHYAYDNGKWIVDLRECKSDYQGASWNDCNEIIKMGENAGQTNIDGCWEENIAFVPGKAPATKPDANTCKSLIVTKKDPETGTITLSNKEQFWISTDGGTTGLRVLIMAHPAESSVALFLHVNGTDVCVAADSKVTVLFTDGSKTILNNSDNTNCKGETMITWGGVFGHNQELDQLKTKKIALITIAGVNKNYETKLSEDDQTQFYNLINCLTN